MSKLLRTKLRDKILVKHGFPFLGDFFESEGNYIVLTPGNFYESGGFKFDINKAKFYSGPIPAEYICKKGDLIVAMTEQAEGLLGSMAFVPEDDRFLHNQRIGLIKIHSEIDKVFLFYQFQTKSVREQIRLSSSGSKVKHTSPERIYDVEVSFPDLSVQQKIAAVLSPLDAKIELNNRINAELEAMAKTLYDYWFVQFDFPNEEGKPYKSSGGTMVWNEELKREIPEGWEVKELWEVIEIKYGKDHKHLNFGSIPVFGSGGIMRYADKALYDYESILIPRKGTLSNLFYLNKPFWSVDTMFFSKMKIVHIGKFLFYFLHSLNLASLNAGTAVPSLTTEILNKLKIVIPSSNILKKFDTVLTPAFEMKEQVTKENQQLSELRDWLLPMLMNGQVKVQ